MSKVGDAYNLLKCPEFINRLSHLMNARINQAQCFPMPSHCLLYTNDLKNLLKHKWFKKYLVLIYCLLFSNELLYLWLHLSTRQRSKSHVKKLEMLNGTKHIFLMTLIRVHTCILHQKKKKSLKTFAWKSDNEEEKFGGHLVKHQLKSWSWDGALGRAPREPASPSPSACSSPCLCSLSLSLFGKCINKIFNNRKRYKNLRNIVLDRNHSINPASNYCPHLPTPIQWFSCRNVELR